MGSQGRWGNGCARRNPHVTGYQAMAKARYFSQAPAVALLLVVGLRLATAGNVQGLSCAPSWMEGYTCVHQPLASTSFSLHWQRTAGGARFAVQAQTASWLVLGLSADGRQANSDVLVLRRGADDAAVIETYILTNEKKGVSLQSSSRRYALVDASADVSNGRMELSFECRFNGDGGSVALSPEEPITALWAAGSGNSPHEEDLHHLQWHSVPLCLPPVPHRSPDKPASSSSLRLPPQEAAQKLPRSAGPRRLIADPELPLVALGPREKDEIKPSVESQLSSSFNEAGGEQSRFPGVGSNSLAAGSFVGGKPNSKEADQRVSSSSLGGGREARSATEDPSHGTDIVTVTDDSNSITAVTDGNSSDEEGGTTSTVNERMPSGNVSVAAVTTSSGEDEASGNGKVPVGAISMDSEDGPGGAPTAALTGSSTDTFSSASEQLSSAVSTPMVTPGASETTLTTTMPVVMSSGPVGVAPVMAAEVAAPSQSREELTMAGAFWQWGVLMVVFLLGILIGAYAISLKSMVLDIRKNAGKPAKGSAGDAETGHGHGKHFNGSLSWWDWTRGKNNGEQQSSPSETASEISGATKTPPGQGQNFAGNRGGWSWFGFGGQVYPMWTDGRRSLGGAQSEAPQSSDSVPMQDLALSPMGAREASISGSTVVPAPDPQADRVLDLDLEDEEGGRANQKIEYKLGKVFKDHPPRSSIVGGVLSNIIKMFVCQKVTSIEQMSVLVGGDSFHLLGGKTTGFRVYMREFTFEGALTTEAEAHTLPEMKQIKFDLGRAQRGGKLLTTKVPMVLAIRVNEADAAAGLRSNQLLRELIQEGWNHIHGHSIDTYPRGGVEGEIIFPMAMPEFRVRLRNGLVLLEETFGSRPGALGARPAAANRVPAKWAMRGAIEKIDGQDELVLSEVDYPSSDPSRPGLPMPTFPGQAERARWRKVVNLPTDIRWLGFTTNNGWLEYSYAFDLDI